MKEEVIHTRSNKIGIIISLLIIASVLVVFIDLIFPLTPIQSLVLRTFDLAVVVILALDFVARLKEIYLKTPLRIPCDDSAVFDRNSR
jgi:hypothetical protein